jgi:YaiO family outer membrane protein
LIRISTTCFICIVACLLTFFSYASEPDTLFNKAQQAVKGKHYIQAEHYLKNYLQINNNDLDAKFLLASIYAWQAKFDKSFTILDGLIEQHPRNSDYLLAKANAYIWSGNPKPALVLLSHARKLSPDYREIWRIELQTLNRLADEESRASYSALLAEANKRFDGENWLSGYNSFQNHVVEKKQNQIGIDTRFDTLSNDLPSWRSYGITASHSKNNVYTVHGKLLTTKRFNLLDREASVGIYYNLSNKLFLQADSSYSPSYKVLPRWTMRTLIGRKLNKGYNVQGGIEYRNYTFVDTSSVNAILERYLADYRLRYTLHITAIDGENIKRKTETSHSVDFSYYYSDINSIGLSISKGKQLEYNGTNTALITDVTTISFSGIHWLKNTRWAPKYRIEYQQQGNLYSRYGIYFSLLHKF